MALVTRARTQWPLAEDQRAVLAAAIQAGDFGAVGSGRLTEREASVLAMRNGLTDGRPRTLGEIGAVLGVSRERVRQLEFRGRGRLNRRLPGSRNWDPDWRGRPPDGSNWELRELLSVRVANRLVHEGIRTVDALVECRAEDLLLFRNLGEVGLAEIRALLAARGLTLAGDIPG